MPDEKINKDPTKKLQELVKKRNIQLIVTKQNEFKKNVRRLRSGGFTAEVYSSFYDE